MPSFRAIQESVQSRLDLFNLIGWPGWEGAYTENFDQGALFIAALDPTSKHMTWLGVAQARLLPHISYDRSLGRIDDAVALRGAMLFQPGYEDDLRAYRRWAVAAAQQGLSQVYVASDIDYPPLYAYLLWPLGEAFIALSPGAGTPKGGDPRLWTALAKLPPLAFDIARFGMRQVDFRARVYDAINELERTSLDYYATVRSLYRQRRTDEIRNGVTTTTQPMRSSLMLFDEPTSTSVPQAKRVE